MPSTVEELSTNHVKLTIEVPFAELKPSLDKAYKTIAQQISVPGFRKGHVPAAIIDRQFGKDAVIGEAIQEIVPNALGAAIEEHKIVPMGEPAIEIVQAENGKDLIFTAEVDKRPEFEMPKLKDIKVTVDEAAETGEDEVTKRIDMLRERFATYTEVERKAKKGDFLVVDLKGSKDGEPLPEATAEGVAFRIGDEGMLEGLDKAVTGLKAGESKNFTSTLVGGPLKGSVADIEVTVQKVQEQKLPDLDDDFAQMVSSFDTVDEMKADLAEAVERMAAFDQAASARDKALEAIVDATKIELPEGMLDREIAARKENIEAQLARAGMKLDEYLEEVEEGKSVDDFWAEMAKNTEIAIKAQLLLDKVAEESELSIDQQDLTQHIMRRAQANGSTPEQEMQHMMEHNHLQEWVGEIRRNKALDSLMAQISVVDAKGKKVDMSVLNPQAAEAGEDEADAEAPEAEKAEDAPKAKKAPAKKAAAKKDDGEAEEKAEEKPAAKKAPAKKTTKKDAEEK